MISSMIAGIMPAIETIEGSAAMKARQVDLGSMERAIEDQLSVHTSALEQKRVAEEVTKSLEQIVAHTEARLEELLSVYEDLGGDRATAQRWRDALYPRAFRFANMSLKEAVQNVVNEAGGPIRPDEIVEELRKGGAALWARDPVMTVRSILWRGARPEAKLYRRVGSNMYGLFVPEGEQMELSLRSRARRPKKGGGRQR
jgi:hypothetical protein